MQARTTAATAAAAATTVAAAAAAAAAPAAPAAIATAIAAVVAPDSYNGAKPLQSFVGDVNHVVQHAPIKVHGKWLGTASRAMQQARGSGMPTEEVDE